MSLTTRTSRALISLIGGGLVACAHAPSSESGARSSPTPAEVAVEPASVTPVLSMAVLPVTAKNLDARVAATLTSVLTTELASVPGYRVITADDINATLAHERQRDLFGCDEANCMIEIGGALGVDRLLASAAGAVGNTFVVNLTLIDAQTGLPLERAYQTGRGRADILIPVLRRAVHQLFALAGEPPPLTDDGALMSMAPITPPPQVVAPAEPAPTTGELRISTTTPGAIAMISGPRGYYRQVAAPWTSEALPPGEYTVHLSAPGRADKKMRVRVSAGETNAVVAELEPGSASTAAPAPVAAHAARSVVEPNPPPVAAKAPRAERHPAGSAKRGGTATFVLEEPPAEVNTPNTPWYPCRAGQTLAGKSCRGKPGLFTWAEAQHACPAGYRLPMHEELLGLLDCYVGGEPRPEGCLPCAQSAACRAALGEDRGRYWTASSIFDQGFVADLARGTVDRVAKSVAQQVRCARR